MKTAIYSLLIILGHLQAIGQEYTCRKLDLGGRAIDNFFYHSQASFTSYIAADTIFNIRWTPDHSAPFLTNEDFKSLTGGREISEVKDIHYMGIGTALEFDKEICTYDSNLKQYRPFIHSGEYLGTKNINNSFSQVFFLENHKTDIITLRSGNTPGSYNIDTFSLPGRIEPSKHILLNHYHINNENPDKQRLGFLDINKQLKYLELPDTLPTVKEIALISNNTSFYSYTLILHCENNDIYPLGLSGVNELDIEYDDTFTGFNLSGSGSWKIVEAPQYIGGHFLQKDQNDNSVLSLMSHYTDYGFKGFVFSCSDRNEFLLPSIKTVKRGKTDFYLFSEEGEVYHYFLNSSIDGRFTEAQVSPNPSTGTFNITLREHIKSYMHVAVFDINGQRIPSEFHWVGTNTISVELGNQSAGIYIVKINSGTEEYSIRILLEK